MIQFTESVAEWWRASADNTPTALSDITHGRIGVQFTPRCLAGTTALPQWINLCIMVRMKTVFLTGGTGFIGSHAARRFLAHGWRVRALVRRPERAGLLPRGVEMVHVISGEPCLP